MHRTIETIDAIGRTVAADAGDATEPRDTIDANEAV